MVEKRYAKRREQRIARRNKKKMMRRRRRVATGIIAAVVVFLSGRFIMTKQSNNSSAVGPRIIEPSYSLEEQTDRDKKDQLTIEYVTEDQLDEKLEPRIEKKQMEGFQDQLDCFLQVSKDTTLYARNSSKSNVLLALAKGTYVETFGKEGEWTKVMSKGKLGYVRNQDLSFVADASLFKVVDHKVVVNKIYKLPLDYETVFQEDAEASLRVMLEAMERQGKHLEVATTYRGAEEEAKELVLKGNPTQAPEPGHSVFQTGRGVEFYVAGTDPRMDNDFEKTEQFAWLKENAGNYGFILRYPEKGEEYTGYPFDPTVFYYVGIEDATNIMTRGITLEEYYGLD